MNRLGPLLSQDAAQDLEDGASGLPNCSVLRGTFYWL